MTRLRCNKKKKWSCLKVGLREQSWWDIRKADLEWPFADTWRQSSSSNAWTIHQRRIKHTRAIFSRRACSSLFDKESAFRLLKLRSEVTLSAATCAMLDGFQVPFPHFQSMIMIALSQRYLILNVLLRVVPLSAQATQYVHYTGEKPEAQMD